MRRFDNRQPEEHLIWIESVTRDIDEPLASEIKEKMMASYEKAELQEWIVTASSRLCEVAKNRVEQEIKDHYADAMYEHLDAGMSLQEAHRAAMEALGNPQQARRTFTQTYLTYDEHARLQKILKPSRIELVLMVSMVVIVIAAKVMDSTEMSVSDMLILSMFPVMLAFMVFHHIIASRMSARRVLAWSIVAFLGMMACAIALGVLTGNVYIALIIALFSAVWIPLCIRLWFKVGRDLPPEEICQSRGNGNESV